MGCLDWLFLLLGVMFIGFKIAGVIAWPWMVVLWPFWAWITATLIIIFITVVFG